MNNILTIAKREAKRLRSRFRGGSRVIVLLVLVGAFAFSGLAFQQMPTLGQDLYRVGVSPDGPSIQDSRFHTIVVDRSQGYSGLAHKVLDVYVDGARVISRNEIKSLYAVGALKRYLEKRELARINSAYDIARAFPLRVEINYLTTTVGSVSPTRPGSIADLIGPWPPIVSPSKPGTVQVTAPGSPAQPNGSDTAVMEQVKATESSSRLPEIKFESTTHTKIIVPSLMGPAMPFAQVIVAFIYLLPVSLVSVFFTSSFMDEKTHRRLTILMSAPVTPFQIIAGKMLPYVSFSLASVAVVGLLTRANLWLTMAIFIPVILFIFAIYLTVPFLYRTFKDTTFISMLATAVIVLYLIFPAMFSGVNDLVYMSPLTLAVKMYRGEPFGLKEYLFSTTPMVLLFMLSVYVGTRVLNEEYLVGFRPLHRKIADAIYWVMDHRRPYLSIALLSLFLIPVVFMIQLVALALSFNLPLAYAVGGTLVMAVIVEEIAKSVGIVVLLENGIVRSAKEVIALSFLSTVGFLIGEKLLLYVSLGVVSQSVFSAALFDTGPWLAPLVAHFVFTSIVCLLRGRAGVRYSVAVLAGAVLHSVYSLILAGGLR